MIPWKILNFKHNHPMVVVTVSATMELLHFQPVDGTLNKMIDLVGTFLYLTIRRFLLSVAAKTKKIKKRSQNGHYHPDWR